jgi:hypothetical protein
VQKARGRIREFQGKNKEKKKKKKRTNSYKNLVSKLKAEALGIIHSEGEN